MYEYMMPESWKGMYEFDCMINRAIVRLGQIADSERVWGYEDSARMYTETAAEIGAARVWVTQVIREMNANQAG